VFYLVRCHSRIVEIVELQVDLSEYLSFQMESLILEAWNKEIERRLWVTIYKSCCKGLFLEYMY
jgi:hypothetical protein